MPCASLRKIARCFMFYSDSSSCVCIPLVKRRLRLYIFEFGQRASHVFAYMTSRSLNFLKFLKEICVYTMYSSLGVMLSKNNSANSYSVKVNRVYTHSTRTKYVCLCSRNLSQCFLWNYHKFLQWIGYTIRSWWSAKNGFFLLRNMRVPYLENRKEFFSDLTIDLKCTF